MKTSPGQVFTANLLFRLRQLRIDAGLTQRQLAERIEQTQSFISKYETGELRLDIYQLTVICEACGTRLSFFIKTLEDDCR